MLKPLLIVGLMVVLIFLILQLHKYKIIENMDCSLCPTTSESSSSTNFTILLANINDKYDALEKKYGSLQEEIQTNSENIGTIYKKYSTSNDKLQSEMGKKL